MALEEGKKRDGESKKYEAVGSDSPLSGLGVGRVILPIWLESRALTSDVDVVRVICLNLQELICCTLQVVPSWR